MYFLNYGLTEQENGAKIYSRTEQRAASPEEKEKEPRAPKEEEEADHEKGDGELMQAMFDESTANGYGQNGAGAEDECSSSGKLDDLQAEYEQGIEDDEDSDFIEDIFSAEEKGEELQHQATEKARDAKKKA